MSRSTKKQQQQKINTKKPTWTHNEDSDQPDHLSSLNRILDFSCELIMDSQGPNAFSREQRILLKKKTALGECVIILFLSCPGSHVTFVT